MRGLAIAAGLVSAVGALIGAGFLALQAQASAENLTGALVAAELKARTARIRPRSTPKPSPATSATSATSATASAVEAVRFQQTTTFNGNVVYVPEGCAGTYDVMLHFHGAHPSVKELLEKAQLRAVVAVFNAGNGAERYGQAFQPSGTLSSLLRQVAAAATPLCGGQAAKPGRVALSAWSAGYAAAEKLVTRPEDRARVDAILLADGLHAGFTDPRRRLFAPNALKAFRDWGELAKRGEKLFAITHSSIATDGYASTTECSKLLLEALNVPPEGRFVSGQQGAFSIQGSTGEDKAAHIAQFRQMDATLLSKLRVRWAG